MNAAMAAKDTKMTEKEKAAFMFNPPTEKSVAHNYSGGSVARKEEFKKAELTFGNFSQ